MHKNEFIMLKFNYEQDMFPLNGRDPGVRIISKELNQDITRFYHRKYLI